MTTGRINQVATIHFAPILMTQRPLSQMGVHQTSCRRINYSTEPQLRPPCSPDLTNFKHSSPCHTEQQRSWPSKGTTNSRSTKMLTAAIVDSQVANRRQVWLTASKPTFSIHCKHLKGTRLTDQESKCSSLSSGPAKPFPSQYKSVKTDNINALDQEKPVIPTTEGILDKNYVSRSTFGDCYKSTSLQLAIAT